MDGEALSLRQFDLTSERRRRLRWIRLWIWVEILGLVVSGVTAFPLAGELRLIADLTQAVPGVGGWTSLVADGPAPAYASWP